MKIVSKVNVGKKPVYDLSVKDKEQYVFANGAVTHNTGILYSASTVLFITKSQEKDGTDLTEFKFTLVAEKSRSVREKSKFPLTSLFESGINKYSGLLDLAQELDFVRKPKNGRYSRVIKGVQEEKTWTEKTTSCPEFWDDILNDPLFEKACKHRYQLVREENVDEYIDDDLELSDDDFADLD